MKITDSPAAMLVMPFSGTAAANDSELSSIFQPVMSTARAAVLVTSNQSARDGAVAAGPGRHLGDEQLADRYRPGEPISFASFAATKAPLTPTALSCEMVGVVQPGGVVEGRETGAAGEAPKVTLACSSAAAVEEIDGIAAGAQADAGAGVAADLQAGRRVARRTRCSGTSAARRRRDRRFR